MNKKEHLFLLVFMIILKHKEILYFVMILDEKLSAVIK